MLVSGSNYSSLSECGFNLSWIPTGSWISQLNSFNPDPEGEEEDEEEVVGDSFSGLDPPPSPFSLPSSSL